MAVVLVNGAPSSITQTSAFLECTKATIDGPTTAACTFYYGTSDGGTVEANWTFSAGAGNRNDSTFGVSVSGLTDHEIYYFRCKAVQDLPGGLFEITWSSSAQEFSTLSYPQKVSCASAASFLHMPIQSSAGRWSDGICPASVKEHFRGGVTQMYGVTHSHLQLTTHTTTPGSYTVPNLSWNTTQPFNKTYTPPVVSGGQVQGPTAMTIGLTPAAFDFSAPIDQEFWALKKGPWKITAVVNVNGSFYNSNPFAGGIQGGPYTVRLSMFPYSTYLRPARAIPPFNYTLSIPNGGQTIDFDFVLRSDCFWFCNLTVEVWAQQSNQASPVSNVDICTVDAQLTRNPPNT